MSSKPAVTKEKSTQTSTAEAKPWGPAEGYLTDLYSKGANAVNLTNNKLFEGDFIAPATAGQRSSVAQLYDVAPGLNAGATDLRGMAQRIASGEFLDPNNSILQNAIRAVNDPVRLNLLNNIVPQIADASIKGGAYGGTAPTLLENQAASDYTRNSLNSGASMTLDWLNSRFGDIFNSPELFQSANTLDLAPATVTGAAGETERGLNQLESDNAVAKYNNSLTAPFFGLQDFANLLTTGGFGTKSGESVTNSSTTSPAPDMLTQLLQGGLGGLSTLSSLGKAFPQTMGAAGSTMASMFPIFAGLSDRRYKTDIKKIGVADNGLPLYRFKYIGMPNWHIGFMADEVEKVKPNAVYETSGGVKHVDYHAATER